MSVRIVENFWRNVQKNESLIKRCFTHHYKRHPDPEGAVSSYNNLLVRLHELDVFERFELRKLVVAAHAEGLIGDQELTPELLKSIGINVEKKWEQFMYKWIEKIVNEEYNKNGTYSRKFVKGEELHDYGIPRSDRKMWIEDRKEAEEYEAKFKAYNEEDRRGRKFPPTFSNRYRAGEEGFDNQLDAYSASELRNQIIGRCSNPKEILVFELLEQGYAEKDIAEKLGCSCAGAGIMIRKIRDTVRRLRTMACA